MSEYKHLPSRILRCPSAISTTDGGLTPLTDLSSPGFRSPVCWFSVFTEEDCSSTFPRIRYPVKTNMLSLRVSPAFRIDEYQIEGNADLVACVFDRLSTIFATHRIIMLPGDETHLTSVLVISDLSLLPVMYPIMIDGAYMRYISSHASGCSCRKCGRALSYLIAKPNRVGKFEYLASMDVLSLCHETPLALPGFKAIMSARKTDSPLFFLDLIVKWFAPSQGSLLETIQAALSTRTRRDVNRLLENTWLYTKYNGRSYRFKRIVFDMTPLSSAFVNKKTGDMETYAEYVFRRYCVNIRFPASPLVEVYAEKRSETCLLIPELCVMIRSGSRLPVPMHVVHAQTRLSPRDRLVSIEGITQSLKVKERFKSFVEVKTVDAEGTTLPITPSGPLIRNRSPLSWIMLLVDCPFVEVPLTDVGPSQAVATCTESDAHSVLGSTLRAFPQTELVMVVLRSKSGIYSELKCVCCLDFGIPCQMVRYETLSQRPDAFPDIADQIGLKTGASTNIVCERPVVGLDYHRFGAVCVFSACVMVDGRFSMKYRIERSDEVLVDTYVELLRELKIKAQPLVYVASRRGEFNTESLRQQMSGIWESFSLVIVCVKTDLRVFRADDGGNVAPGFVLDTSTGFHMVSHEVRSGNALPVLYEVSELGPMTKVKIEQITLDLCIKNQRLPIVFAHTRKLSELIGIHFKKVLGKGLEKRLASSPKWPEMFNRSFYL